jgi:arylsulfatase A-like enzyme
MNRRTFLKTVGLAIGGGAMVSRNANAAAPPNVVFIMTDNQGAWTLGCYGNPDIRTPNLDRMAREGMRFTRAFSNNAVCSPTRASYLTGLMPSQHGVHKYIAQSVMLGPKAYGTLDEFDTLPQILSESGYVCGLSGKWHLGDHTKPQEGFSFWVTKPGGHSTGFENQEVIENGETHRVAMHQTEYWTQRGIEFIEQNKDRPFFLFLAYNGPYGLGKSTLEPPTNRHADYYADKDMASFPREEPHPWLHNNRQMMNNIVSMRKYASEVSGVDDGIGAIMHTLKENGLDDNTVVVFTADQGWAGGHSGFWGMGDHTRPLTAFDWTMHVPLIWRHPGRIPAGQTADAMVSNYDFMATMLTHLALESRIPTEPESPGRSYDAFLQGGQAAWDNVVFYEFENVRAIRTDEWKCIERIGEEPNELYDIGEDPGERTNLHDSPEHVDVRNALHARLHTFFDRHAEPKWDLWKGGDAKGGLIMGKEPYRRE